MYVTLTFTASLVWYLPIAALSVDGGYFPVGFGTVGVGVLALMLAGSLVAILTSFRAIATGDVSYVAPISKLIPVFVLPLELVVLDERLSPLQATGAGVATESPPYPAARGRTRRRRRDVHRTRVSATRPAPRGVALGLI